LEEPTKALKALKVIKREFLLDYVNALRNTLEGGEGTRIRSEIALKRINHLLKKLEFGEFSKLIKGDDFSKLLRAVAGETDKGDYLEELTEKLDPKSKKLLRAQLEVKTQIESEKRWGSEKQFVINTSRKYGVLDMYYHSKTGEEPGEQVGKNIRRGVNEHIDDLETLANKIKNEIKKGIKPEHSVAKYLAEIEIYEGVGKGILRYIAKEIKKESKPEYSIAKLLAEMRSKYLAEMKNIIDALRQDDSCLASDAKKAIGEYEEIWSESREE